MTENQVPAWTPAGDLTAVPQLRALGAAIGMVDDTEWVLRSVVYQDSANDAFIEKCKVIANADIRWPANDNLPPVVAFTGLAGSGKSTATRYLVERHGYTLVKFAGPLKRMCYALGMTEDEVEGDYKEVAAGWLGGKTPRFAMQTLGTEWGRKNFGDDFWVNQWKVEASSILYASGRVVTDDCRFPNEAQAIRRLGGDIYKIDGRGGIAGEHISERGCGDQDLVIENTGAVEELHGKIEEALRRYG